MSRADQSLSPVTPKTWSARPVNGTGAPCSDGAPTTKPSSASMSSRRRRAERRRALVGRLALPGRPGDRRAGHDDGAGPAVVADREVPPVRGERLAVGPEHLADVGRVVERGVEVDVVGDLEGQVQSHLLEGQRLAAALDEGAHLLAGLPPHLRAERHEGVERRLGELRPPGLAVQVDHPGPVVVVVPHADPARTARDREDAVRQVVEPEPVHRDEPELAQVGQRLGDRAGAERREPATGAGQVELTSPGRERRAVALLQHVDDLVQRGAVEGPPGRDQHVEEAVVLEAVVAGVPHGVVQAGRALERRLAVQRRVDPAASACAAGNAAASSPPVRNFSRSSAAATSSAAASQRAVLPTWGSSTYTGTSRRARPPTWPRRPRPPPGGRCRPGRRGRAARSRARRRSARACAQRPAGPGELAGAAGDHHRQRTAEPADQRQVGVLQHEGARPARRRPRPSARRTPPWPRAAEHRRAGRSRRRRPDGPTHRRVAHD